MTDYNVKLGLDSKDLEKQYKEFYKKLEKVQGNLIRMYKNESKWMASTKDSRRQSLRIMEKQLAVQRKLNSLQSAPVSSTASRRATGPRRANSSVNQYNPPTISQKERIGLGARMDAAINSPHLGVRDKGLAEQIQRAKTQMKGLREELNNTNSYRALSNIKLEYAKIQKDIARAVTEQNKLNRSIKRGNIASEKFSSSMKHMALQTMSVYAAVGAATTVFKIGKEFDSMQAGLLAASESAGQARENMEFLKQTAQDLGTPIESGVRGFNRLGIAMRGAGFSAEELRDVYTSAQEAIATAQLDQQRSNLVMLAMSQIVSKGKVSSEELNRQLGENLPFAMQAAEMATGLTTDELFKMMKQGKLLSKDFIKPFAKALSEIVRQNNALAAATEKLTSQQNRLSNAFKMMIDDAFQSGGAKSLGSMFKTLADSLEKNSGAFSKLIKVVIDAAVVLVEIQQAIISVISSISDLLKVFDFFGEKTSILDKYIAKFYRMLSGIYSIIAALKVMQDVMSWDTEALRGFYDGSSAAFSGAREATKSDHRKRLEQKKEAMDAISNRKSVKIDTINLTSTNSDPKETAQEFMNAMEDSFSNILSF